MAVRILIIEDNEDNLTLVELLVNAHGHTALLARDGIDGIRMAILERPHLVLLDIRMPGMDGYAVLAALRREPVLSATRIVALTASAMAGERERISAAGFDGYVQKPIDPETFMERIRPFLGEA